MSPHRNDDVDDVQFTDSHRPSSDHSQDAIAIVGYSILFPEDATTSDALWDIMMQKRNTAKQFPTSRLNTDSMYHPDTNRRGQMSVRCGSFIKQDITRFDAPLFGIAASDAGVMDPQQRLLLECTYTALENAGITMENVSGTKTSVFTGSFSTDWTHLAYRDGEQCSTTTALGIQPSVNANRVSWFFNLLGTSANIDTACSSSLVCLDMGCKGLWSGQEDMSIVAGSNVMLSPDTMNALTNLNMLSPDGKCYSFDHRGKGYGRSEGVGVLVLKRVSDAIRDNDTIRGIIRNTGCNQDGHTSSITLPNHLSQVALIRDTYAKAGLSMHPTRFFEAHGTGTQVGDPNESRALGLAFRSTRTPHDPLWVGAVKSNLGHLEGASGVAGVIKALLVLEKALIPPNNNFEKVNPKIDTEFLRIKFPLEPTPWPTQGLRRASVNSFGNSGTNAHVILDDVHHYLEERGLNATHLTVKDPPTHGSVNAVTVRHKKRVFNSAIPSGTSSEPKLLLFSANDKNGPKRQAEKFAHYFDSTKPQDEIDDDYMTDLAYTLSEKRSLMAWRAYAVVRSSDDLKKLDSITSPALKAVEKAGTAFAFTGQGAQWPRMGAELMSYAVFEESIIKSEKYLLDMGCSWNLREELTQDDKSRISQPEMSQPLCVALQIGLIDLMESFNIRPVAVIGHSSGEIAAAYCSGGLSHRSALQVAYYRGSLAGTLTKSIGEKGSMMAVGLSQEEITPYLEEVASMSQDFDLVVACINSSRNVTVSGSDEYLKILEANLAREHVFVRRLQVNVAYHSPHMRTIADAYRQKLQGLEGNHTRAPIAMFSSVTGNRISVDELSSPDYWISNLVSPVKFLGAFQSLLATSARKTRKKLDLSHRDQFHVNLVAELGPHSTLQAPINDTLSQFQGASGIKYVSCISRNFAADTSLLSAIGQIHSLGYPVNIQRVNRLLPKSGLYMTLADLPEYSFDHSKVYWDETRLSVRYRTASQGKLDLLGKPVLDWNSIEPRWRNIIRSVDIPWTQDHVINGSLIYPGAGMLVMAIEAANQLSALENGVEGFELRDVSFLKPLPIPGGIKGAETHLMFHLTSEDKRPLSSWSKWRLITQENDVWVECCAGEIKIRYAAAQHDFSSHQRRQENLEDKKAFRKTLAASCQQSLDIDLFYQSLTSSGLGLGPSFQRISSGAFDAFNQTDVTISPFEWPTEQFPQPHIIHPTTLDCLFHSGIVGLMKGGTVEIPTMVPTYLQKMFVSKTGLTYSESPSILESAWIKQHSNRAAMASGFALKADESQLLLEFQDLQLTVIAENQDHATETETQDIQRAYHILYHPDLSLLNAKDTAELCRETKSQSQSALARYVELLGHKKSSLRILAVGTTRYHIPEQILETLAVEKAQVKELMANISHLSVICAEEDHLVEVKTVFGKTPRASYEVAEHGVMQSLQSLEANSYDVVFAPQSSLKESATLKQLRSIVKTNGKLILYANDGITNEGHEHSSTVMNGALSDVGFHDSGLVLSAAGYGKSTLTQGYVFEATENDTSDVTDHEIQVIIDSSSKTQGMVCSSLISCLQSRGLNNIKTVSLKEASECANTNERSTFISLLEFYTPFLFSLDQPTYEALKHFLTSAKSVFWVNSAGGSTAGAPKFSMANGLARALRSEYEDLRFTTMSYECTETLSNDQLESLFKVLNDNHLLPSSPTEDQEYLEVAGRLMIPRITYDESLAQELEQGASTKVVRTDHVKNVPPLTLAMESAGLLNTLHFIEDETVSKPLASDEIDVQVRAIGVNWEDYMVALGRLGDRTWGQECSGVVKRAGSDTGFVEGDRVLVTTGDLFRTVVRAKSITVVKVPDSLPLTVAAAIPAHFTNAWVAIHRCARLQTGETILIHSGMSGVGQAAIQISHLSHATVYTTVSSVDEKARVMELYNIPEHHIFYSNAIDLTGGIKRANNGRGVDVIMNAPNSDILAASWDCIAPFGRLIDFSQADIMSKTRLPALQPHRNASFHSFDQALWSQDNPDDARSVTEQLVKLFETGTLHPGSPLEVKDIGEVKAVFEAMRTGANTGKFVLSISPESKVLTRLSPKPSFQISGDASYVIAGGLGGIGRATARFLVDRGARHLVLLSRSGPRTESAHTLLRELSDKGVQVHTPKCDIGDASRVQYVFQELSSSLPPIKGCIQAALDQKDYLFKDMTYDHWQAGVGPKAAGSWNLHTTLPPGMDFFIMLSSGSGLIGFKGQANYDAGNTFEDALASYRVARGEKATTFILGAMADDGILAETPALLSRVLAYGSLEKVTRQKYFSMLDHYCNPSLPLLSSSDCQVAVGVGSGGGDGLENYDYSHKPMLRPLEINARNSNSAAASDDEVSTRTLITNSTSLEELSHIVSQIIGKKLGQSLPAMQDDASDLDKPLQMQGVDSLLAIQLRNWIAREFATDVAVFETQGLSTLGTLSMLVAARTTLKHPLWSNF